MRSTWLITGHSRHITHRRLLASLFLRCWVFKLDLSPVPWKKRRYTYGSAVGAWKWFEQHHLVLLDYYTVAHTAWTKCSMIVHANLRLTRYNPWSEFNEFYNKTFTETLLVWGTRLLEPPSEVCRKIPPEYSHLVPNECIIMRQDWYLPSTKE